MNDLVILWLDDQRDPYRYLNTKSASATFARNKQFYDNLMSQYNAKFVWVKNLYQFIEYIEKNGVPEFVSFDHDLNNRGGGEGLSDEQKLNNNGVNAAKWLVSYCKKMGQPLPKFYVHSANPKHGPEINRVLDAGLGENKISKKVIRITENDLHKIIKESVNIVLNEIGDTINGQFMLGGLKDRNDSKEIEQYAQKARNLEKNPEKKLKMNWAYNSGNEYFFDGVPDFDIMDVDDFRDLCEKLYPFKEFLSEIEGFGPITSKGEIYAMYDENINNFISEYEITDFYDKYGSFDEEKLKEELNSFFETDIYSEY